MMRDLEDRIDRDLDWYAVQHHNTDDPHVHVVLSGTGIDRETGREEPVELTPQDFRSLRESGREHSDYDLITSSRIHCATWTNVIRSCMNRPNMHEQTNMRSSDKGPPVREKT